MNARVSLRKPIVLAGLVALVVSLSIVPTSSAECAPRNTPTCDPNGNPIGSGDAPSGKPAPSGSQPSAGGSVKKVAARLGDVKLGGGKSAVGAEGVAIDPVSGLAYVGINGTIISGCAGDTSRTGTPSPMYPGANQLSVVDLAKRRELASTPSGAAPIWPLVDRANGIVWLANSGDGTIGYHKLGSGERLGTVAVGGKPHAFGLDPATGVMVVSNTVKASEQIAEQNHMSAVSTSGKRVTAEWLSPAAPHGIVVDSKRHIGYAVGVGDGEVVRIDMRTGRPLGAPVDVNAKFANDAFGGNNMLARSAAKRLLFVSNTQPGATGALVVDEKTLAPRGTIVFRVSGPIPWGMAVDEAQQLLFAALPNANAIGVADIKTLRHVATIPVGTCPYAVALDPKRMRGVATIQSDASATVFDVCKALKALGRRDKRCKA